MKKGLALLLSILATAAVAASAQGGRASADTSTSSAALSCKSTLKIGFVTPLTGGAGFLGNARLSWPKYALTTLTAPLGLIAPIGPGHTPVAQGPAPAEALALQVAADKRLVAPPAPP